MKYDSWKHRRRSIRLAGYDYAANGAYFVTICLQDQLPRFGQINQGMMVLNEAGAMVAAHWSAMSQRFPAVSMGAFVVMPDHLHGIIILDCDSVDAGTRPTLGTIVGTFKSLTTRAYSKEVCSGGYPPFERRLWQRNYFERIIRNAREYEAITAYIENNPANWQPDR